MTHGKIYIQQYYVLECYQNMFISHSNPWNGFNLNFADMLRGHLGSSFQCLGFFQNKQFYEYFINTVRTYFIGLKHVMCSSFTIRLGAMSFSSLIRLIMVFEISIITYLSLSFQAEEDPFFSLSLFYSFLSVFPSSCLSSYLYLIIF